MGRPRLEKKLDKDFTLRLNQDDRDLFEAAAARVAQRRGKRRLPLAEWLREVATLAARDEIAGRSG